MIGHLNYGKGLILIFSFLIHAFSLSLVITTLALIRLYMGKLAFLVLTFALLKFITWAGVAERTFLTVMAFTFHVKFAYGFGLFTG